MDIAFFDFDGTITSRDSFMEFIIHAAGKDRFVMGMTVLMPVMFAYKLRIIPNWRAKEIVLSYFFKGWGRDELESAGRSFAEKRADLIIKDSAGDRIRWHKERGDRLVLVSASVKEWLLPWAEKNGFDLLCTELKYRNGKFTGKLSSKNCHGEEKVNRIKAAYELSEYSEIYAYGDTSGDLPMLELASQSFYRHFN